MDTTKTITHVSLCAGYGGIDLGLSRAIPNLRTIAFSEIEAFACANLVAKMEAGLLDAAPIWTNLKTFPWSEFRDRVDILSGGYPCQPFSAAGKRLGTEDPRHLWPFIAAGIVSMRPRVCFFENVEGHISLGLREVISELEGLGYQTTWGVFSAREVGAPHQRKRVFILAIANSFGSASRFSESLAWDEGNTRVSDNGCHQAWPSRPGQPQHGWEPPRVVSGRQALDDSKERSMRDDSDNQRKTTGEGYPTDYSGLCSEPPRVVGDSKHNGSHQCDSEARGEDFSSEQGRMQELEGGSSSMGYSEHDGSLGLQECRGSHQDCNRSEEGTINAIESEGAGRSADSGHLPENQGGFVGNSESIRSSTRRTEHEGLGGQLCTTSTGSEGAMGNSETGRRGEGGDSTCERQGHWFARSSRSNDKLSQTQPSLGGVFDGSAYRMDDAELFVTSDNRTDELRLLGNGVVPATATRAFLVLMDQLLNENP